MVDLLQRSPKGEPGGLLELLKLALPAGISQASFSLMMFTDRLLLTPLGKETPAASMLAGFTSFLLAVFFFGLLNYITPLVAQLVGSGQPSKVSCVVHQGVLITLLAYPLILILGELGVSTYFDWTGIHTTQKILAKKYFTVINIGSLFTLLNIVMSSFFAGVGRTYVVMVINTAGMILNIPVSYCLIHSGVGGFCQGIEGAALGSILSTACMFILFGYVYLSSEYRKNFKTNLRLKWDRYTMRKLIYFGSPSGIEMLLTFLAFSTFVALFHSYGANEALAATIALNWDIVAFMPVWGISIGLMSLVGKYMGARDIKHAVQSVKSGAIASFATMLVASVIFFTLTEALVGVFLPDRSTTTYDEIMPLASTMLKLISLYCFANAANLTISGALRAAGDTKAVMCISVTGQWLMLAASYLTIKVWECEPLVSWSIFVCSLFFETLLLSLRFYQGSWKKIQVV